MKIDLSGMSRETIEKTLGGLLASLDALDSKGRIKPSAIRGVKISDFTASKRRNLKDETYLKRAERVIGDLVDLSVSNTQEIAKAVNEHAKTFGFYQGSRTSWEYTQASLIQLENELKTGRNIEENVLTIERKTFIAEAKRQAVAEANKQIYARGYKYSPELGRRFKKSDIFNADYNINSSRQEDLNLRSFFKENVVYRSVNNLYRTAYAAGGHWRLFAEGMSLFHPAETARAWNKANADVFNVVFASSNGSGQIGPGIDSEADEAIKAFYDWLNPGDKERYKKYMNNKGVTVI